MNALRSFLVLLRRVAVWLLLLPIRFYQWPFRPIRLPLVGLHPLVLSMPSRPLLSMGRLKDWPWPCGDCLDAIPGVAVGTTCAVKYKPQACNKASNS